MKESMTEVATTTLVVRVTPAGDVVSDVGEGNHLSLGKAPPKDA
jgi:hypothetical protein